MEIFLKILWAIISVIMIFLSIYFTKYFNYPQFKISSYINCFKMNKDNKYGISPLKTLMLTLAGRIGVGSIAGIALAIYIGGSGTIFWVWVISILTLPLAFSETILGSLYKKRFEKEYIGGPSYYIKDGLKKPQLAKTYAFLIILSFILGFLGIQVNTITRSFITIIPVTKILVGIIISIFTFIIIIGDIDKISNATSKIVPFMLFFYLILCMYAIIIHIEEVPLMLINIIKDAFKVKPFFSGFLYSLIIGIQRGIFSSEAGIGTGSITSSASNSMNPKLDGYLQMLGVSVTTLIVCSITAFIVLLSPYHNLNIMDLNGIEVASYAFGYHFKDLGIILMFIFIFLCSFSTILTGYYDSLVSLRFLFKKHYTLAKYCLIIFTIIMILTSSILSSKIIWNMVDFFTGILMLINLYALFNLKDKVKNIVKKL